jgi:hypothetical protein
MNERDLILGGALSLAAAAASAEAQTAPKPGGAPSVPGDRGETMNIMFKTSTNLNDFMPKGITCVDPHRAFIKGQRKKGAEGIGNTGLQICISTMATSPKYGPRQRNILMWESAPWGIGSTLVGVKRWAESEMTYIFEQDRELIAQGSPVPFYLDVQEYGYSLLSFAGVLDGKKRVEDPPYSGMYIGGEPGADLLSLTFDESKFSRPVYGTGTLKFGEIPIHRGPAGPSKGWSPSLLKDIKVEGCIYEDMEFTRSYGTEFETVRKALPA